MTRTDSNWTRYTFRSSAIIYDGRVSLEASASAGRFYCLLFREKWSAEYVVRSFTFPCEENTNNTIFGSFLKQTLAIPLLISLLFIFHQVLHILAVSLASVLRRPSTTTPEPLSDSQADLPTNFWEWIRTQIDFLGGKTITSYLIARFVGCLILLGLSIRSLFDCHDLRTLLGSSLPLLLTKCPEIYMTFAFVGSKICFSLPSIRVWRFRCSHTRLF